MSRVHRRHRSKKSQNSTIRRSLPKHITTAPASVLEIVQKPAESNCLICKLSSYKPDRDDLCLASPAVKTIHDDLMCAGRRALGNAIYRPLETSYAAAFAAA